MRKILKSAFYIGLPVLWPFWLIRKVRDSEVTMHQKIDRWGIKLMAKGARNQVLPVMKALDLLEDDKKEYTGSVDEAVQIINQNLIQRLLKKTDTAELSENAPDFEVKVARVMALAGALGYEVRCYFEESPEKRLQAHNTQGFYLVLPHSNQKNRNRLQQAQFEYNNFVKNPATNAFVQKSIDHLNKFLEWRNIADLDQSLRNASKALSLAGNSI